MKVLAPKGSMVFWDSRTIHKPSPAMSNRINKTRWRFVIYVCYTPEKFQSEADKQKKKEAYINNSCTSHWPFMVTVFRKNYNDKKINNIEDLTERQKKCIGIKD